MAMNGAQLQESALTDWPIAHCAATKGASAAVLHVIYDLERAGTQQMLVNLVRCINRRGARHAVCAWRAGGALARVLQSEGIPTFLPRSTPRLLGPPVAIADIAGLVRRLRVSVIHGHLWDSAVMAFGASRITGVPYVVNHRSPELIPPVGRIRYSIYRRLFSLAVRGAAANVAVTESVRQCVIAEVGLCRRPIEVIDNGISLPDDATVAAAAARRWQGSSESGPSIVTVGRLVEMKGHDQLINAAPRVLEIHPNARFVFVGDGPQRAALLERARQLGIAEKVCFTGEIDDVGAVLSAADLYVSTSHFEGMPRAVLEAMSWGLPVIASRVSGNVDAVIDNVTGRLFDLHHVGALAAGIREFLASPTTMQSLGRRARAGVIQRYSLDHMASAYDAIYDRVAGYAAMPAAG